MASGARSLDDLRREIDRIDVSIHELLMQRTAVVLEVSRAKGGGSRAQFFRPGREATILRRLVERHSGAFPQASLVRIWREIMSGQLRVQTEVTVAVCTADGRGGVWDTARDQYGAAAHYRAFARPSEVVAAVRAGAASIGVLPMPEDGDQEPWWPLLAAEDAPRILSRLPFITDQEAGQPALAIGFGQPDPSDRDRGCLIVESERSPQAITDSLKAAGVRGRSLASSDGGRVALIETDGLIAPDDRRLERVRRDVGGRVIPVGGYAVPIVTGRFARTEVA